MIALDAVNGIWAHAAGRRPLAVGEVLLANGPRSVDISSAGQNPTT